MSINQYIIAMIIILYQPSWFIVQVVPEQWFQGRGVLIAVLQIR